MRNLILYAKYFAIENESAFITKEHIVKAFEHAKIDDESMCERIEKLLNVSGGKADYYINAQYIKTALEHKTLGFDDDVKYFLAKMQQSGYGLDQENIQLQIQKDVVIDVEDKSKEYRDNARILNSLGNIKDKLTPIVFDQEIAIESVKDTISRAYFEERENSVKAILFFIGPPATGKTYLAEETGKLLKAFGYTTKVFNMTLYSEDTSNLTGLAEPRVGAGKGDLTKQLEKYPKSLIVFDEIEKCHPIQQRNLFRLLDRGYVEDKFDNSIVDATESIIIFTSNLGKAIYERNDYSSMIRNQQETESLLLDAIAKEKSEYNSNMQALTPALVSRLSASKVVLFNKIGIDAYFKIAKEEINRYFDVMQHKFGINFEISDAVVITSLLKYMPFFDPRRVKGKIGDDLFDIVRDYVQREDLNIARYNKVVIDVDVSLLQFLQSNIITDLEKNIFNTSRFEEFIDKKETLFVDTKYSTDNSQVLTCILHNGRIEKVKNIQDFVGDVKIELDIPSGKIKGEPNANIFGHTRAKEMLVHIAKRIQKFQNLQRENDPHATKVLANIPKGILLYGPPGTGKTKIARAFAAQVECPIIVTSGKEMTTMQYVGTGVAKIKEIFKKARDYAPSVLFIDEIDAIGRRGSSENAQENNKNINALLEELDGFNRDVYKPVFVIAATNRKESIDPAILRAGRIEEHIEIGQLDKEARAEFLRFRFENDDDFSNSLDIEKFLKYTAGMSGADIEMVIRKAKYRLEIKREVSDDESLIIDLDMLIDVANEIRYGTINKSRIDASFENRLTAYHEAGHAVVSLVVNPKLPINQITIVSRDDFAGFVSFNHEEIVRYDKEFYIGMIATAYGGRLSEEIYFEHNNKSRSLGVSTGASSDIEKATMLIKDAILKYGMDEELGLIHYERKDVSASTQTLIDKVIYRWSQEAKLIASKAIQDNWVTVEKIAKELEENERIDGIWIKENIDHLGREC